ILTRSITRPISRLFEVTRQIAAGDLSQRAEVTSKDELGGLAVSFNQITESLQKSRNEIEEKNRELEAMNEELRTSNEELRETQEQLVRSEKLAAIGELAGGVGHELRNPLGAIKNAVYYVRRKVAKSELGEQEPRVMEFLDIVDGEINSSEKIINDLLGFSRVGKPSAWLTHIERVIEDAISHIPIPENIELDKKLDTDLPEVEVDKDQIRQVLMNLLTNGVQSMPEGGRLTVAAGQKDGFLEVKIADTGQGIPGETLGKIFDPLFTTKAKGIGLGLAVCKAIIERHQGHIEVESEVGQGTVFTLKLPLPVKKGRVRSR
ncbi:MAG: ATP-binding protein, partial [Dehalococcoidales bacterium]